MRELERDAMGVLEGLFHLLNFFAPALGVGVIATGFAKLLWRRELKGVSPWRMASWAVIGSGLALVAGLVWTGHDGKMGTYGFMVAVCALSLWWAGWLGRRR
jgi:hypothetical protein